MALVSWTLTSVVSPLAAFKYISVSSLLYFMADSSNELLEKPSYPGISLDLSYNHYFSSSAERVGVQNPQEGACLHSELTCLTTALWLVCNTTLHGLRAVRKRGQDTNGAAGFLWPKLNGS